MKVTVCELPDGWSDNEASWTATLEAFRNEHSDLLLLPEMPFHRWLATADRPDAGLWKAAVTAHERRIAQLAALRIPVVIGSRPVLDNGCPHNRGFVWEADGGLRDAHTKYHLPDEKGYWEATWYRRGDGRFEVIAIGGIKIGFLICTELWFNAHARAYAAQGIHLLVCPRVTP
ncbi:MAG TPA: carbon-nitrogen hydrolase family protein, partial [Desulfosarcina sp.]|nr:carbon-nitrogen hydrolase family protein [Desulfosarcina sp.]